MKLLMHILKENKTLGIDNTTVSPDLIKEINIEHKDKLISKRHWIPETGIEIDIKK